MQLTRRYFLKMSGAIGVCLGAAPLDLLARSAGSDRLSPVKKGKTLVILFLRGGSDGLNLVVPFGDSHYYRLRRSLAIQPAGRAGNEEQAIDLDGFFGLNPRLKALVPFFDSGLAVAVHAVGHDKNTRSHFEEQDVWETGIIGNSINSSGWVNRHLVTSTGHSPIRAVSIGNRLPRIMQGKAAAHAIRRLEDLSLPESEADNRLIAAALEDAYRIKPGQNHLSARELIAQAGTATLQGIQQLGSIAQKPYQASAEYPETELAQKLEQAARLIKSNVGVEVIEVDYEGWDTHQDQGEGTGGPFGDLAQGLGDAVSAFMTDLKDRMDDVLVVTLSDFGRTAAQNGTQGTDHGWGNCLFALGGSVQKVRNHPKVQAQWPGMSPDQLQDKRDLAHNIDFRDVLAEVVRVHLGNPHLQTILPNHKFKKVGLV